MPKNIALTLFIILPLFAADSATRVGIAVDIGPVTLAPGQSLRRCASDIYGDTAVSCDSCSSTP